jgi:hypothetical protein
MIGFISALVTSSLNHTLIQRYPWFTHFPVTVVHALGFSVFTSRILATDLNTETSTSTPHHEVFLIFRLQSLWNLGTKNSSGLTPPGYDWLVTALELTLSLHSLLVQALCTVHTALCTLPSALCTLLSAHCAVHTALCTLHPALVSQSGLSCNRYSL